MRTKTAAAAIMAGLAMHAPGTADAGVPVIDSSAIQKTITLVNKAQQQINKLQSIKNKSQDILKGIGSAGSSPGVLTSPNWQSLKQQSNILDKLRRLPPNLCQVRGCPQDMDSSRAKKLVLGEISNLSGGVAFAKRNFYSSGVVKGKNGTHNIRGTHRRAYSTARRNALRQAAISGYSLALVSRDQLSESAQRIKAVESVVNDSSTLRSDVKANSAVLIAQMKQLAHLQAIAASSLQIRAANVIATDDRIVAPGGSSTPPPIYEPSDYNSTGTRTDITNSAMATGSAAGVSRGGATGGSSGLLSAISEVSGGMGSVGGIVGDVAKDLKASGQGGFMSQASSILEIGSKVAKETGATSVARVLEGASSAANGGSPEDVLWAGAEAAAEATGNYQLNRIVGMARNATQSGSMPEARNVLDAAKDIAQARGRTDAASYLSDLQNAMDNGKIDRKKALANAVQTTADIQGNTTVKQILDDGPRIIRDTKKVRTANRKLSSKILQNIATGTGNGKLTDVAIAADRAADRIRARRRARRRGQTNEKNENAPSAGDGTTSNGSDGSSSFNFDASGVGN